jgi:hypothetical protein
MITVCTQHKFRRPRDARFRSNVFAAEYSRCRCVVRFLLFLAPQCAALRCPWISALEVPVLCVPSCARGPPCVFVYCKSCTTELYCTVVLKGAIHVPAGITREV